MPSRRVGEIPAQRVQSLPQMTDNASVAAQQERLRSASKAPGVRTVVVALIAFATGVALATPADAARSENHRVWFLKNGRPVSVARAADTLPELTRALLAGPTQAERRRGLTTAIPSGVAVRRTTRAGGLATIDLAARFTLGTERRSLTDRIGQLVRTVRSVPGVTSVKVRIEGGVPVGLFPGYDLRRPVSKPLEPAAPEQQTTRGLQQLLVDLGFMDSSGITGRLDDQTSTALLGFQKWTGLVRSGMLSDQTVAGLRTATRPQPVRRAPGHRIEVNVDRQVALLIDDGRVERVVHISSGAGGATPLGTFRVFRKERYSWSIPFKVWLPWASYFVGGVAFHEFGSVPTYAASHGCIRVNRYDAPLLYEFAGFGTRVDVFHEARI